MREEALPPAREQARIVARPARHDAGVVGAGFVAYEALESGS